MADKDVPESIDLAAAETQDVKFEDVLQDIGGFGWFQRLFACLTIGPQLVAAMVILSPIFTGSAKVPLYCTDENWNWTSKCNVSCIDKPAEAVVSSIVQEWDLVCHKSWVVGAITSFQMAGMMTGALTVSIVSDNYGRIPAYWLLALGTGFLGMLPALAFDPWSYAIARFLAGFGMGGTFVGYLVHLMEFLTPEWRTICGAVAAFPLGEMTLALITYNIKNWRIVTVLCAAPIFILVLFYRQIHESPRWLLTRKRTKEAHQVLYKVALWNSKPVPELKTIEKIQNAVLKEEEGVVKGFEALKQITVDKRLFRTLLIVLWANVCVSVIYYGVSFNVGALSGDPSINLFYSGILDLLAIPAVWLVNDRLGRRKTYQMYMCLSTVFMMIILVLQVGTSLAESHPILVTAAALISRLGVVCSWASLTCITLESFPTTLRSSCLGACTFIAYCGGIVAPQSAFLGTISPTLPYIMYFVLAFSSLLLSVRLTEVAGVPLSDTIKK